MNVVLALLIFALSVVPGFADCPYRMDVGPEIYYITRVRDGGTHQSGHIDAISLRFERIKRCGWYLGADYLYGKGELDGKTGMGFPLFSELTDQIFEFRLGYTLACKEHSRAFITPFVGGGHFQEVNQFSPASPIPCTFTDSFSYATIGFLSGMNFTPWLSMGINFKLRFMREGKSKVSDDPFFENVILNMEDEIQIRLDVPLVSRPCKTLFGLGFLLSPFFEYRHFGGREGFPFNFRDTKFYLFGAKIALTYQF